MNITELFIGIYSNWINKDNFGGHIFYYLYFWDCKPEINSYLIKQAGSAKGKNLIQVYEKLVACDKDTATTEFETFMKRANEIDTLSKLANVAVQADIFDPIWKLPGNLSDYTQRDELVRSFGQLCTDSPNVSFSKVPTSHSMTMILRMECWIEKLYFSDFATWLELPSAPPQNPIQTSTIPFKVYTDQACESLDALAKRN